MAVPSLPVPSAAATATVPTGPAGGPAADADWLRRCRTGRNAGKPNVSSAVTPPAR